jgi:hypothetical protein
LNFLGGSFGECHSHCSICSFCRDLNEKHGMVWKANQSLNLF